MIKVEAIQNKAEQERICKIYDVAYDADLLAYAVYSGESLCGIIQFTIRGGAGRLYDIAGSDSEALFIAGRAALNFIDLCGIKDAYCETALPDSKLIRRIGFRENEEGRLYMNLKGFFEAPCEHS